MWIPAVSRCSLNDDPECQVPFVHSNHAQRGRLADDGTLGQRLCVGPAGRKMPSAEGANLLVAGEDEHERLSEFGRVESGGGVGGYRQKTLHVRRSTAHVGLARFGQPKRIGTPIVLVGGNDVHVPGQHQPFPMLASFRPNRDHEVGLATVRRRVALHSDAGSV